MLDEMEFKICIKVNKVIDTGKINKSLSELKPFENVSQNLQSFLEISPVQQEVLPSYQLQGHANE